MRAFSTSDRATFFAFLIALLGICATAVVASPSARLLERDPAVTARRDLPSYVLQEIPVRVGHELLHAEPLRATGAASLLEIEVAGLSLTTVQEHHWSNPSGSSSWIGSITEDPMGSVVVVTRNGAATGTIRAFDRLFVLRRLSTGQHVLQEIDEYASQLLEEAPAEILPEVADPADDSSSRPSNARPNGPEPEFIDLMVVYTAGAMADAGGTPLDIENRIDLGVTEANLSYMNSDVDLRMNLVKTRMVTYSDSGSVSTDRNRLRDTSDGYMDEVHGWRDAYGADIVQLIVGDGGCGIAYIMTSPGPAFASSAFCVTWEGCISPNYTFSHEMGHLQSARHDYLADSTTNSPYAYNHGYFSPTDVWRTVMSYNNCGGGSCTRQLYWSNPGINHPVTGEPMGVGDGEPQEADNHRTLNNTAAIVAAFRGSAQLLFEDGFESGDTTVWSTP